MTLTLKPRRDIIADSDLDKIQISDTIIRLDDPLIYIEYGERDLSTSYPLPVTLVFRFFRPTRFTTFPLLDRRLTYIPQMSNLSL